MSADVTDKLLCWDSADGDHYTLSRFKTRLTTVLYLMEPLIPSDGTRGMGGDYVLNLNAIGLLDNDDKSWPRAQVFDDYDAFREFRDYEFEDGPKRVLHLASRRDKE